MVKAILGAALLVFALARGDGAMAQNAPAPAAPSAQQAPAPTAAQRAPAAPGPIAALQQQLKEAGDAPGPVNGVMTEKTGQAIAAYERRTGRPPPALTAAGADPVRRVQAALQRLGMLRGPADGIVGPQTRAAIIQFEAARHLAIDPRVSDALLAALDKEGARATPTAAAVPPAAHPPAAMAETPPEAAGRQPLPSWVKPPPIH